MIIDAFILEGVNDFNLISPPPAVCVRMRVHIYMADVSMCIRETVNPLVSRCNSSPQ